MIYYAIAVKAFCLICLIVYAFYFWRNVRTKDLYRFNDYTALTMLIAGGLPVLHFIMIAIFTVMFRASSPDLMEVAPLRFYGSYMPLLPVIPCGICAWILYKRKTLQPADMMLVIWGVLMLFNLMELIAQIASLATWKPYVMREGSDEMMRFLEESLHVSRETILINTIPSAYWVTVSAIAAYNAFMLRRGM